MTNNDLFRRLRYILHFSDSQMAEIFNQVDQRMLPGQIASFLKRQEEEGFCRMDDSIMGFFLDGLINLKRGKREAKPGQRAEKRMIPRTNNDKLKKLRIAFNLQEASMLEIFSMGDFPINKAELSALFRKKDHRNYKVCGDQGFRKFLNGLAEYVKREGQ